MYIDPNTGGMLFQILAVLFGTFSAIILFFSGRIRMLFARMRRSRRESEQESTEVSEVMESARPDETDDA